MSLEVKGFSVCILVATFIFSVVQVHGRGGTSWQNEGRQTWSYVEVRPGAHMFWWLYYANSSDYTKLPLVIWLQGGPGASSTGYGNFEEIGPKDVNLNNRTQSWVNYASILFVDNPVGTGFSYVNDTSLLARNNSQIAEDLVEMTRRFFEKVPEFQDIPLYIFSESYGGKMAAQFAYRLNKFVVAKKVKCNLQGVSLGDSWISPIDSVLTWAPYLYSMSMIDNTGFAVINQSAYGIKVALDKEDFTEAEKLWDLTEGLIDRETNGVNFYNILQGKVPDVKYHQHQRNVARLAKSSKAFRRGVRHLSAFHGDPLYDLMNGPIKKQLRVIPENVTWGGQSAQVFEALSGDFMIPVVQVVERILNNTPVAVTVYNGQLDLIVDTMGTLKWVEKMQWPGTPDWKKATRVPVLLNNSTEAFVKTFKSFSFYWILKAGHMVPADAPNTAAQMFQLVVKQKQLPKVE